MKKHIYLLVALLAAVIYTEAQTTAPGPKKLYKTWISVRGDNNKVKGALYEVRDSCLIISSSYQKDDYFKGDRYYLRKLNVSDIEAVSVRRNKAGGRSILIGSLSGIGLGAVMGMLTTTPGGNEQEQGITKVSAALVFGLIFGIAGGVIGAAFSPIKTRVAIHGDYAVFNDNRKRLQKRSLTYDPLMEGQRLTTFTRLRDSVTDIDGNWYHVVSLGAMVFMEENLRVIHYRDGKAIATVTDPAQWKTRQEAALCQYEKDTTDPKKYGFLYNGYVVRDTSGICPAGWHVPTLNEWNSLIMCLGGDANAGGYLKEEGDRHWNQPNYTMFSGNMFALPSGNRLENGKYSIPGSICHWWAKPVPADTVYHGMMLRNGTTTATITQPGANQGLSIRCMRE